MRKLITRLEDKYVVVCDNPSCNFEVKYKEYDLEITDFINTACPNCGENLLTEKDYLDYIRLMKMVDWINKWFSWITIFHSKNNTSKASVKVHNGLHIKPLK